MFVHLFHRFFHRAAEIAPADAVLDGNITAIAFAINFGSAVGLADLAELRQRYAFSRGREQPNVLDRFLCTAVLRQVTQGKIVARFALEDLGERVASHCGLNRILHIGDIDLVASGGIAIHGHVQIGLAEHAEDSEIFNAIDLLHDADDLVALVLQSLQIVAVDLGGQRAFYSTDRLFHVVFDGLRETPDHARESCRVRAAWRRSIRLCSRETRGAILLSASGQRSIPY